MLINTKVFIPKTLLMPQGVVKVNIAFWSKPRTVVVRKIYPMEMSIPTDREFEEILNLGITR